VYETTLAGHWAGAYWSSQKKNTLQFAYLVVAQKYVLGIRGWTRVTAVVARRMFCTGVFFLCGFRRFDIFRAFS
jgi:hypothetical protein